MLAESIARIHAENLAHLGVLALTFTDPDDRQGIEKGTTPRISDLHNALRGGPGEFEIRCDGGHKEGRTIRVRHDLSSHQVDVLLAGGSIAWKRRQLTDAR